MGRNNKKVIDMQRKREKGLIGAFKGLQDTILRDDIQPNKFSVMERDLKIVKIKKGGKK